MGMLPALRGVFRRNSSVICNRITAMQLLRYMARVRPDQASVSTMGTTAPVPESPNSWLISAINLSRSATLFLTRILR